MVNTVVLVGRLCTGPTVKQTPSGVSVASFRLAVDRPFKDINGERGTDYIDVECWRQQADFVGKYLTKGRLVFVGGRLQVRQWQTPEGQRRSSTEVVAEQVRAIDKPVVKDEVSEPVEDILPDFEDTMFPEPV